MQQTRLQAKALSGHLQSLFPQAMPEGRMTLRWLAD